MRPSLTEFVRRFSAAQAAAIDQLAVNRFTRRQARFEDTRVEKCRVCGCTEDHACNPPCAWFEPELCSTCALAVEFKTQWLFAAVAPNEAAFNAEVERRRYARANEAKT